MNLFKLSSIAIVAMLGLSASILLVAQDEADTDSSVAENIANDFNDFLGDDSGAFVDGLRNGDALSLGTDPAEVINIENNAGPMGFGEVSLTLGLAESLLGDGATHQEIADALHNDKGVGILDMRADDLGWGQIFAAYGTTVGAVMSRLNANEAAQARLAIAQDRSVVRSDNRDGRSINRQVANGVPPERPEQAADPDRPERPERATAPNLPDRPERPERPDRPELPDRPQRPERPELPDRPDRPERPDLPVRGGRP